MKQDIESNKILILVGVFLLIFLFFSVYLILTNTNLIFKDDQTSQNISNVCFFEQNKTCFNVEVVQTINERQKGLMFRENLDNNSGMLFIFPESNKHGFWMKNTLIPLDIIWIDQNKTVVYIKENIIPCKVDYKDCPIYYPQKEALYVLEVNFGKVKENNLSVGENSTFI